jgi:hypothetical protein
MVGSRILTYLNIWINKGKNSLMFEKISQNGVSNGLSATVVLLIAVTYGSFVTITYPDG